MPSASDPQPRESTNPNRQRALDMLTAKTGYHGVALDRATAERVVSALEAEFELTPRGVLEGILRRREAIKGA